ncbi:cysteine desulfurase [Lachnospiraceae bacterium MD1]|uniref:cysteine desulfurase n=1 Tax=Variimorphobacter saccharofermentans TaxID=2755051 RepID=A0A839JWK5_9FIRM|nr:cysteine desulfurase family protein [Variimorphobacter saccharofermentans]MBB2181766.1 cysteine desulfurase [Variimorphobacter saccharofermentans]
MIYFDNSATSPVDEEVLDAMLPYLREEYGNPSSKYYCKAVNAHNAVEEARAKVAKLVGANPQEIVFTAGATESTNFIIKGYMDYRRYYGDGKNHIITSVAEHKATLNTCKYLNGDLYSNNDPTVTLFGGKKTVNRGYEASFVGITETGEILVTTIDEAIKNNTAMVSVIYVNNEVGTISNISEIAKLCAKKGIAIHSDLTQAIGKMAIDVHGLGIDFASCSAHKIYGPKGVGAAFVKSDAYGIPPITAFMHGGEQENGFRAGTLAVHNIVGFGKAAEIALRDLAANETRILSLDQMFIAGVAAIPAISLTNKSDNRLPGIISIVVDKKDFNNERFIKHISDKVALSTGSACSAGEPSYVITALGLEDKVSKVLRISLNKYTTEEEVNQLIKILREEL